MSLLTKWSFYLFMALAAIRTRPDNRAEGSGKAERGDHLWPGQHVPAASSSRPGAVDSFNTVWSPQAHDQVMNLLTFHEVGDQSSGLILAPVDDAARAHLKLPKGQGLIATSVAPKGRRGRASARTTSS